MKGIIAFFWKDLKEFFNSREAMFWFFVFPVIFGLLFASVFGGTSTPKNIPVGYVPESGNATVSREFIRGMENVSIQHHRIFEVNKYLGDEGMKALKTGKIKALIIFGNNFSRNASFGEMHMTIIFDHRDLQDYQVVSASLLSYVSEFENRIREVRVNLTIEYATEYGNVSISKQVKEYLYNMSFPLHESIEYYNGTESGGSRAWWATAAIGITLVFSGMIGAATSVSREIEKGTARRLINTKTTPVEMLVGTLLYLLLIQLISAFIVLLSFAIVFGEWIDISPAAFAMLVVAAISTMSIGLLISSFTKTQRAASAATNAIAWPISFITGIFFPSFMLPEWMRSIGDFFPASALLRGVRKVVIYNQPIGDYAPTLALAIVSTILLLLMGSVAFRWRMRRE